MRVYTVHAPAERGPEDEDYIDSFVFVREGFRWLAFLVPALWLLANRIWWPLLAYLAVAVAIGTGMERAGLQAVAWPLLLGLNLFVGFEADSLKRWTLERRGWRMVGIATGRDRAEAERGFFSRFAAGAARLRGEAIRPGDMVGLFPEAGR